MMVEKAFQRVDERLAEYRELLKEIVTLESYTPDKAAVDKLGSHIREFSEARGFHVHVEPFERAGNGLLITMNEEAPLPAVAFTGHMDTVFPEGTFAKPVFREENGRFYGPGVTDMKGGIVVALLAKDNPLLIPLSAAFIAYINTGANIMAMNSDVSSEVAQIIQGAIMLLIAAGALLQRWRQKLIDQAAEQESAAAAAEQAKA